MTMLHQPMEVRYHKKKSRRARWRRLTTTSSIDILDRVTS